MPPLVKKNVKLSNNTDIFPVAFTLSLTRYTTAGLVSTIPTCKLYNLSAYTPILFEFSLFQSGLDSGGIIIPKKLFRRILRWKK
uniref:Uncharacterized protein n=1 Tax=Siphoviridae sp. ct7EW56 TaxID=2827562 RepID=A0A8S5LS57_9CAUD|nr:MAG TPA: hypothetical protein [Siphoviridae sp. ct7EW56]